MRIFSGSKIQIHRLPDQDSLGKLLIDIGVPNIIRGDSSGSAGIDWIIVKDPELIDREVTLLHGEELPVLTLRSIISGVPNVKHPLVEEYQGDRAFKLLSARYNPTDKKITVSCNVMEVECKKEDFGVAELRKLLCPAK